MVFSSLLFLFRFLPAVLLLYYIAPRKIRNLVLFLFSLLFYAWGEPKYVFLMLFSITMDFFMGQMVAKSKARNNRKAAKRFLTISIVVNLSILAFFKYADFIIGTINSVAGLSLPMLSIPLPIGISFFTFQTMSYVIDVYKGATKVQKNWVNYGTYVSMFPQLIAGPIVQYKTIAEQMEHRKENASDFAEGIHRFLLGMGKKVLLANTIGLLCDAVMALEITQVPVLTAWLGAIAYTFQIYFDFSGYSDMAIGLGKMFGFHFLENFNYPYISRSITEFWRRWHISLSSWFKEYVYIPLGGNRRGVLLQARNILVVWMLTGIWHGASWNYVLWGVYYGILLMLEKFLLKPVLKHLPGVLQNVYTMVLVIFGWVLFKCEDLSYCFSYLKAMVGGFHAGWIGRESMYLLRNYGALLVILLFGCTMIPKKIGHRITGKFGKTSWIGLVLRIVWYGGIFLISLAYLVDATYNPFLYFRF
ncbi:MAG: MBOAT family protein [Lachnospiraceae bacterium]